MEIVTYRDLDIKDDIFLLWLKSFGWPGTAEWFEKFRKLNSRIGDGPAGMCGLEKGRLVGFVGIMSIPTRTSSGDIENVGGIYAIAVRPDSARRGIGRRLLEASEDYLRREGKLLVFLTTSRSIVAYQWYYGIGYKEVENVNNVPYMYKYLKPSKVKDKKAAKKDKLKLDFNVVQEIWDRYTRNRCGFVFRDLDYLKAKELAGDFVKKESFSIDNGYVLARRGFETVQLIEILARTQKSYSQLIRIAENRARYAVIAYRPFDPAALKSFDRAGYRADMGSFGVLMCKQFGETSFADLYDDSFMISRADWF